MRKLTTKTALVASTLLMALMVVTACKKPQDTTAKIYVRDADSNIVSGATVALYGEPSEPGQTSDVGDTTETNAAGEAIFNLNELYKRGQAGVAVLNISASKGTKTGSGIIKIEEEKLNEETVFIQE